MMPLANIHNKSSALRCPARLSQTRSILKRRQLFGQGDPHRKPLLPALPLGPVVLWIEYLLRLRQGFEIGSELLLEPGMEHLVGGSPHTAHPHLACGRVEQGKQLGCSPAYIFVRPSFRLSGRLPARPGVWHRLVWPRLILGPHRQPFSLAFGVGVLDQLFWASASGSTTVTTSPPRFRSTTPLSHQLRSFCQSKPASVSTFQMVWVETPGSPSSAPRNARRSVLATNSPCRPCRAQVSGAPRRGCARARLARKCIGGPPPWRGSTAAIPSSIEARNQARDGFPRTAPGSPGRVGVALPLGDGEQGLWRGRHGRQARPDRERPVATSRVHRR